MTRQEIERMEGLCRRIQVEKDPKKFTELVALLNDLLEDKSERLEKANDLPEGSKS
jgi:hypothetical protein